MPTFQIPSISFPAGEEIVLSRTVPQRWGMVKISLDIAAAVFPLWFRIEYSNDNGATWQMMMNFDVTELGHDKQGNLVTTCDFSVAFPDQFFIGGTRARVIVTSPAAWTSSGGTATVS